MEGEFKISPLKLNSGLGQLEIWNEVTIKTRAGRLAESATDVWRSKFSEATLVTYRRGVVLR